jgi:uncharacterized alpha-E superfamily protein
MIARVAGHCCWLYRYVERLENTASLLSVMLFHQLDVSEPQGGWRAVLVASDERPRFVSAHGEAAEADGEMVQAFMTWDEANPVSLISTLGCARENARSIRETISLELWQTLNALWLWMGSPEGQRVYARDRQAFYSRVRETCQIFHGLYHTTMLYEEAFDMMRLGGLLERAAQTTRMLSSIGFATLPARQKHDAADEAALALATLRACAGLESFLKRTRGPLSGAAVADFLVNEMAFPRSVRHCLERARYFLMRGRPPEAADSMRRSLGVVDALLQSLPQLELDGEAPGVRARLRKLSSGLDDFGDMLRIELFEPALPELPRVKA